MKSLNLDQWFRRCRLKIFLTYSSGSPFVQQSRTALCTFGKGHHEHFCEIILNLDQWFRRCCLKRFLIWSSGSPLVRWSGTICAILEEGIMENIPVKLIRIFTSGSGDVV